MKKKDVQVAIVVSEYNETITSKLLKGALARLLEVGMDEKSIAVIKVPGAVEIPLTVACLAKINKYQAIICLGAVIRGETSHYDYVCQMVSQGCLQVMLEFNIPVVFGVLTTDNIEQAEDRVGGKEGHKGVEAADTAMSMMSVVQHIITSE